MEQIFLLEIWIFFHTIILMTYTRVDVDLPELGQPQISDTKPINLLSKKILFA